MPRWFPRFHSRRTKQTAEKIRGLIRQLTEARVAEIAAGTAPDDLATKIMTTADPQTGKVFGTEDMIDQVAIFFLAGHETSASALGWALYMLAMYPDVQDRVAAEAMTLDDPLEFTAMGKLKFTRDVFRETLRLYPPVPMMVRENTCPETFRGRDVAKGAQIVLSPWHLQRHERIWDWPDEFDPDRWQGEAAKTSARDAFLPFSAGPRVCPGAGFAMVEGPLLLALLIQKFCFATVAGRVPVPVAHLTVRAKDGIWMDVSLRRSP